jgi:hypothetical protein
VPGSAEGKSPPHARQSADYGRDVVALLPSRLQHEVGAVLRLAAKNLLFHATRSELFDPRWFELLPRITDKKVFENELAFAAVQRAAAAATLNPSVGHRRVNLDAYHHVLRAAVRAIDQLVLEFQF